MFYPMWEVSQMLKLHHSTYMVVWFIEFFKFACTATFGLQYATQPILACGLTMIYHELTLFIFLWYRICFKASNSIHFRITPCGLTWGNLKLVTWNFRVTFFLLLYIIILLRLIFEIKQKSHYHTKPTLKSLYDMENVENDVKNHVFNIGPPPRISNPVRPNFSQI